jgi:hypothetical protein
MGYGIMYSFIVCSYSVVFWLLQRLICEALTLIFWVMLPCDILNFLRGLLGYDTVLPGR